MWKFKAGWEHFHLLQVHEFRDIIKKGNKETRGTGDEESLGRLWGLRNLIWGRLSGGRARPASMACLVLR